MPEVKAAKAAIRRGLHCLAARQLANGGFASYSSPSLDNWQPSYSYRTCFVPTIILDCLSRVTGADSERLRDKIAGFILCQQSPAGSLNYWDRQSEQAEQFPYPDDLDDSFCGLAALLHHDRLLIDGAVLAKAVKMLLANEQAVGGPYYTWLTAEQLPAEWRDVDVAVNANIAYFLKSTGMESAKLSQLLHQKINRLDYRSNFYPSVYPVHYFLARALTAPKNNEAIHLLQQAVSNACAESHKSAINLALSLSSSLKLSQLSTAQHAQAQALLKLQRSDGSWAAGAFCCDPSRRGQEYFHGSSSLTTALAIEALELYSQACITKSSAQISRQSHAGQDSQTSLINDIMRAVQGRISSINQPLQAQAQSHLKLIASWSDLPQIILLPHLFMQTGRSMVSKNEFVTLGAANLFGWMGYSIADDIIDSQQSVGDLPLVSLFLRESYGLLMAGLHNQPAGQFYIGHLFDQMDQANAWELANCQLGLTDSQIWLDRLPDFGDRAVLAEKSIGHFAGIARALLLSGKSVHDSDFRQLEQGFRHYLIVRQLLDDLHDWQADLAHGRITYVIGELLHELRLEGQQNLAHLLSALQRQLWHHSLSNICDVMDHHLRQSERLYEKSGLVSPNNVLQQELQRLRQHVQQTRLSQQQAIAFFASLSAIA